MFRPIALFVIFLFCSPVCGAELKPIVLDPTYEHDKFVTQPTDIVKKFRAFTVSFDSADDDDSDEIADVWATQTVNHKRYVTRPVLPLCREQRFPIKLTL